MRLVSRRWSAAAVGAILAPVLISSVPAAQRAVPRNDVAVPFAVGESLTYDVSWSSFVVAGTATARVAEKGPSFNATAYHIVVEGRPVPLVARLYNLYYKMETLLDSATLLSQQGTLYSEEGSANTLGTSRFDRAARRVFYERRKQTTEKTDFAVPQDAQDGLAVLYALRGRPFRAGDKFSVAVADGGALYNIQVAVESQQPVRVPAGEFSAWNLKVSITDARSQPVWKNNEVWISNDARRLPVKMQAELPVGHFVLTLREAK